MTPYQELGDLHSGDLSVGSLHNMLAVTGIPSLGDSGQPAASEASFRPRYEDCQVLSPANVSHQFRCVGLSIQREARGQNFRNFTPSLDKAANYAMYGYH